MIPARLYETHTRLNVQSHWIQRNSLGFCFLGKFPQLDQIHQQFKGATRKSSMAAAVLELGGCLVMLGLKNKAPVSHVKVLARLQLTVLKIT